jgi:hypothetical protein
MTRDEFIQECMSSGRFQGVKEAERVADATEKVAPFDDPEAMTDEEGIEAIETMQNAIDKAHAELAILHGEMGKGSFVDMTRVSRALAVLEDLVSGEEETT